MTWGSPIEIEVKRRIKVLVWAYAYEFENRSLVSDAVFDVECYCVNLAVDTNRPDLDKWFRENFNPSTGMWIHDYPELDKIRSLYERRFK